MTAMRFPRARFSVRMMIALVALAGVGLFLWDEFRDGVPPRSTIRSIPGRVGRLEAGMTEAEAKAVLGMDRPWYRGGILVRYVTRVPLEPGRIFEMDFVLPMVRVSLPDVAERIMQPTGQIGFHFREDDQGVLRLSTAIYTDRDGRRHVMPDPGDRPAGVLATPP